MSTSFPYFFLARDTGAPYRHIINYVDWLSGGGPLADGVQIQTVWQMRACNYMAENPELRREVYRLWQIEDKRQKGVVLTCS